MSREPRSVELILTATGGAELIEHPTDRTLWASDTDEEFKEEFTDVIDDNDVEHVLDYLVANDVISEEDADNAYVSLESEGPGDDDDDDDGDDEYAAPLQGEFIPGHGG